MDPHDKLSLFQSPLTMEEKQEFFDNIGMGSMILEEVELYHIHIFLTYLKMGIPIHRYAKYEEFISFLLCWVQDPSKIKIAITPWRIEWRYEDHVLHYAS